MNELLGKALSEMKDIKSKLMSLEEILQTMANTPAVRVNRLLSYLNQFLSDGTKDPIVYRSDAAWAKIEDLAEDLRPVKDQFQDSLFRKAMVWLKDSRARLRLNDRDTYAINQLRGLASTLSDTLAG
jgi:hypothetical protein